MLDSFDTLSARVVTRETPIVDAKDGDLFLFDGKLIVTKTTNGENRCYSYCFYHCACGRMVPICHLHRAYFVELGMNEENDAKIA